MSPEQTILAMFDHLDERRYDALLTLMAPQAVWHRQGQRLQGHAQILAAAQAGQPGGLRTGLRARPVRLYFNPRSLAHASEVESLLERVW